jgi:hypothetical protein
MTRLEMYVFHWHISISNEPKIGAFNFDDHNICYTIVREHVCTCIYAPW